MLLTQYVIVVIILRHKQTIMNAMLTICGFTPANRISVIYTEGLNDPDMLSTIDPNDVKTMCAGLSKLTNAREGSFIGLLKQKNLEALVWWANDRTAQGLTANARDWDAATMNDAKQNMRVESEVSDDNKLSPIPTTFTSDDWSDDHFLFLQHLKQCTSSDGKRDLSYVVRKDTPITPGMSRAERLIQAAPHTGAYYVQDNISVYQKLRT